jgi:hypothetical protein
LFGAKWLYSLAKLVYSLKVAKLSGCGDVDLVVPLGYGLLNTHKLPDAAKETIRQAIIISNRYQAPIAWANADYFWLGAEEEENRLKLQEAHLWGLTSRPIIAHGVANTVTEAQSIRRAVIEDGHRFKKIVVVADWPHARSVRKIWRKVFPESKILVISIEGKWDKTHPAFFLRSELRWLFINLVRHVGLMIFGMKFVSLMRHPAK